MFDFDLVIELGHFSLGGFILDNKEVRYDVWRFDELLDNWVLSKSSHIMFQAIREVRLLKSNGYRAKMNKVVELTTPLDI